MRQRSYFYYTEHATGLQPVAAFLHMQPVITDHKETLIHQGNIIQILPVQLFPVKDAMQV
jgi:hypothetical protein